nr:NAD-dependent epimerase/dehydratase [Methylocystis sp. SC2]
MEPGFSGAGWFGVSVRLGYLFGLRRGIPDRGHRLFGFDDPQLRSVEANIHDERSIANVVAGAYGVVNAVSLYVEHGNETFHSVHVDAAQRVADQAHRAGVERLAHISGIGKRWANALA